MNPEAQEIFDRLVKLNPEDLAPEDRVFLNARRDYLNNEQKRVFESVLNQEKTDELDENGVYVARRNRK